MHLLTLVTERPLGTNQRSLGNIVVAEPPPKIAGMVARSWCIEPRGIVARYLFAEELSLRRFRDDPTGDPVVNRIRSHPQLGTLRAKPIEQFPKGAVDALERPVFIVSAPRAGSTMLFETLACADSLWTIDAEGRGPIEGVDTLHPAAHGYASHRLTERDADQRAIETVRLGYLAALRNRDGARWLDLPADQRPAHPRLLDKTPENSLRIPFLYRVFPDATFVLLHREPHPNVSSILDGWNHVGFVNLPKLPGWDRGPWCFLLPPGWESMTTRSLSDVAALQWRVANEQALDDLECMQDRSWTSVSYLDLATAFTREVRSLCGILRIDIDASLSELIARPARLSATTTTVPSPIKWHGNADLRESSFTNLGLVAGRLRNLMTTREALRAPARPTVPPVLSYACWLRDLPRACHPRTPRMVLSPHVSIQIGTTVPLAVMSRTRYRERLADGNPVVWVEDQRYGLLTPYMADVADIVALRAIQPGRQLPSTTPRKLADELHGCGALVPAASPVQAPQPTDDQCARIGSAAAELAINRYTTLDSVIPAGHVDSLADYYRRLVASDHWELGDGQVERRYGWHNETMAKFFHHQLTGLVSQVSGEQVKRTYAYSSAYQAGAALKAHVDREQCNYTMSVLIDESPEFTANPWPLWFATHSGHRSVTLRPGDAVLFRGCELPHWREESPFPGTQTMLLLHYVPSNFPRALD